MNGGARDTPGSLRRAGSARREFSRARTMTPIKAAFPALREPRYEPGLDARFMRVQGPDENASAETENVRLSVSRLRFIHTKDP